MARPVKKIAGKHAKEIQFSTALKVGDPVLVLTGGNKKRGKVLRGQVGKILRFLPKKNRVVVEGLNIIKRHKRAVRPNDTAGIITKEGSIHISNVLYYSEKLKRPVRVRTELDDAGKKVRGYLNPATKKFERLDA